MESIENIFSDNKGNQLMVALYFYDKDEKINTLNIPEEYADIEIADINIEKVELGEPLHYGAFVAMNKWLFKQFELHSDAIFSFICSLDELDTNHKNIYLQNNIAGDYLTHYTIDLLNTTQILIFIYKMLFLDQMIFCHIPELFIEVNMPLLYIL